MLEFWKKTAAEAESLRRLRAGWTCPTPLLIKGNTGKQRSLPSNLFSSGRNAFDDDWCRTYTRIQNLFVILNVGAEEAVLVVRNKLE